MAVIGFMIQNPGLICYPETKQSRLLCRSIVDGEEMDTVGTWAGVFQFLEASLKLDSEM